jgi:murein DD-endopeptidase MepM/ murein hydrolase activator NlpD
MSKFYYFLLLIGLLATAACSQERAVIEDRSSKFYGRNGAEGDYNSYITHHVAARETLSKLSRRYRVPVAALIKSNHLTAPYIIKPGQNLQIPATDGQTALSHPAYENEAQPIPVHASKEPVSSTPLAMTAAHHSTSPLAIAPMSTAPLLSSPAPSSRQAVPAKQAVMTPLPQTRVTSHSSSEGNTVYRAPETAPEMIDESNAETSVNNSAATSEGGTFSWPVKGTVISRFGPHKGGLYNDGINIASAENTPITAAGDGLVVYSGNELHGYGNLTIIKHSGGLLTAYAHQKDMQVKKGDRIRRGQLIGHIGVTGNVSSPQLHFGIREGDKAVDPELYLSKL